MQSAKLVVEKRVSGECGKPLKAEQELDAGVAGTLNCPLMDYIKKLKGYNISSTITWFKVSKPPKKSNFFVYFISHLVTFLFALKMASWSVNQ